MCFACVLAIAIVGCGPIAARTSAPGESKPSHPDVDLKAPIYQFTMKDINGEPVPLEKLKGKVLLVVNVASKCGLTPQYEALEKLYRSNKERGLVILGFPANEFGSQEPGTNAEIKAFCSDNYDVTFPMFSKIVVKGDGIAPLYQWLIGLTEHKDIEWNFAKFVIGRDGFLRKRFAPQTKPDAPELVHSIEAALKEE
jgi:glutathione peroxidase